MDPRHRYEGALQYARLALPTTLAQLGLRSNARPPGRRWDLPAARVAYLPRFFILAADLALRRSPGRGQRAAFGLPFKSETPTLFTPPRRLQVVATRNIGPVLILALRGRGTLTKQLWMSGVKYKVFTPLFGESTAAQRMSKAPSLTQASSLTSRVLAGRAHSWVYGTAAAAPSVSHFQVPILSPMGSPRTGFTLMTLSIGFELR